MDSDTLYSEKEDVEDFSLTEEELEELELLAEREDYYNGRNRL